MNKRLKNSLSGTIPTNSLNSIHNSYDTIGDIAIIRPTNTSKQHTRIIAEAIMDRHRNVKTVLAQTSPIQGDLRLRKLQHIAGELKTATVHKESGCLFHVDVQKCYFSPRLSFERTRIAQLARSGETVVNMFAGVGSFSILIAKHSKAAKIYSIDVNPVAFRYMQDNARINGVYERVIPILGDAREVIEKKLRHRAHRILVPLPEKALDYLPYALLALKACGGWIHYYDFEHATHNEDPVKKTKLKVAQELNNLHAAFEFSFSRVVRSTGPNWYQTVLDVKVGLGSNAH